MDGVHEELVVGDDEECPMVSRVSPPQCCTAGGIGTVVAVREVVVSV